MRNYNEDITEIYNYVNNSLGFTETKNGVMVALCSGIIIALFSFEDLFMYQPGWHFLAFVPSILALFFSLVSFYPMKQKRISGTEKYPDPVDINLFRCESIAKMPISQLTKMIAPDADLSLVDKQKLLYISKTSVVAGRKYRFFRNALWCFGLYGLYFLLMLIRLLFF